MTILDRYILRAHFPPFIFGTSLVVFLFLLQFIMKYIDQLVGKGLGTWLIMQLIALNMAWMLVLAVPIGVLFSSLMAFGSMSASHEVTIIKASGGSLIRMMMPAIVVGAFLTAGLFYFNDKILPETNHQAKILMSDIKRKKPTFELESGKFSTELDGYTILPRKVDSISGRLYGVTIYDQRSPRHTNIVSADSGIISFNDDYSKLIVRLFSGEIHQVKPMDEENYRLIEFDRHRIAMEVRGFSLVRSSEEFISRGDREMSIRDMEEIAGKAQKNYQEAKNNLENQLLAHYNYLIGRPLPEDPDLKTQDFAKRVSDTSRLDGLKLAKKRLSFLRSVIQSENFRAEDQLKRERKYEVEIWKKFAIPFACFLFVFVGCPLGIITKGGNFGISASITLAFYIIYWICLIGGEKLGDRGHLSPFLAMWLGNFVIAGLGIVLTIRVNNENSGIPGWKRAKSSVMRIFKRK